MNIIHVGFSKAFDKIPWLDNEMSTNIQPSQRSQEFHSNILILFCFVSDTVSSCGTTLKMYSAKLK